MIADATPHLPSKVLAAAADAAAEMVRFDAEFGDDLLPFASILLRSESASSSMIENLTSGAKSIALAEIGSREKRNATLVVGNVAAMRAAIDPAERLDAKSIIDMQAALLGSLTPELTGQWRAEQVWIGGSSFGPHTAEFVPPHETHVPTLMDDLVAFSQRDDIPLLPHIAIAHAQFETIHPFPDGNGRTGRAWIHAMLRRSGAVRNVTIPVSAGLLGDTQRYFGALTAYRAGDVMPIVESLTSAATTGVMHARRLVTDLREIREQWSDRIRVRKGATAWRLADLLLRQPVIDRGTVAHELNVAPQNALRAIVPLAWAGVLTEFTGFKRNQMWQASEVLTALDDFAARAARRAAAVVSGPSKQSGDGP